ncbi:hypothetical protein EDB85DRAFT_1900469 [Lactarius pseudohatsudake]|nr:hypothetical protein EDB85DRAFT_1900469 [Lactarius pseudohatsudake]
MIGSLSAVAVPSPVQGKNKNPSARSSMGSAARPSAAAAPDFSLASPRPDGRPPSGRPTSELLGSATFQTPEADAIDRWFENFHRYEVTLEEMAAASFDVNFKEELSAIEQWFKVLPEAERTATLYILLQHSTQVQIRFFITVLQQMARADPMTALLSPAVGGSIQSQMEAKLATMNLKSPGLKSTMPGSPSARTFNTSATNRQSLAFYPSFLSYLEIPPIPSATQATLLPRLPNTLASSGKRGNQAGVLGQVAERDNPPTQEISVEPRSSRPQSPDFSGFSAGSAFCSPRADGGTAPGGLDGLSPVKTSSHNNNGQTVDLAAAKLNDSYGSSNVQRLDGPDKFRRPSKGHMHDSSSGSNNGVTNNGVYGDDGDLIQGHHASSKVALQEACAMVGVVLGLVLKALHYRIRLAVSAEATMVATRWLPRIIKPLGLGMGVGVFNLGLSSPGLAGMPNGPNMAPLAQLSGMNPFGVNTNTLGVSYLCAMGITPEAQLLAVQIAPNLLEGDSVSLGSASGGIGESAGNGGVKKDEEDFEPAVLNDVAGWLRTLRLHKYTPNFEGMTWKEMVVMDGQALEAQKILKTFEVVRKKMGIDDPTAPPPPSPPSSSGGPAPGAPGSILGASAGSGGGLSA